jgi:hypothetical protein
VLFVVGHSAVALHNAYGIRFWGTLWRTAVVGAGYWIVTVVGLLALRLPAVLPLMKEYHGR